MEATTTTNDLAPVFAYVRVSTSGQAEEGVSLEAQEAKARAWAEFNGRPFGGVYVDAGLSGCRSDNRPALHEALDAACEAGGVLIVYSLSRLSRSTMDTLAIGNRLEKSGADLVSVSESIDTTSAAGKMVFRMLAVLAEFEADLVSERTKAALGHKRAKGEFTGGDLPFGFDLDADGIRLVKNDDEAAAAELIRSLRDSGLSLRKIADELDARGIAAKNGGRWHANSVRRVLRTAS